MTVESSNAVKLKSLIGAITIMQHHHSAKLLFITSCMNLSFSTEFTEVNAGIRQKRQELELSCSSVIARVERCVFWIHGGFSHFKFGV